MSIPEAEEVRYPTLREATAVWAKIGLLSFGGPAGQIALMHRELVDERRWISETRFLHALNFCMLLPGPEAQQLATYIGWLLHGTRGGLVAGILFVIPGFIVIVALSMAYALFQETAWLPSLFFGLKAAVLAVVVQALMRITKRSLKSTTLYVIAAVSFVGIYAFQVPFPLIIIAAALVGFIGVRFRPDQFPTGGHGSGKGDVHQTVIDRKAVSVQPTAARAVSLLLIWSALWVAPVALAVFIFGGESVFLPISVFFSKMAIVTFGGAYAVLSYVAQQAVDTYHWLRPGEMLDGLALAETTPGPLIMVLTYVGFLAAYRDPGMLDPLSAALLGALLTTWVTFVPCFLWIFLGAPYVERLRENRPIAAALSAITGAVVGVILNLTIWFGFHALFSKVGNIDIGPFHPALPEFGSLNPWAAFLAIAAIFLMFRTKVGMVPTLAICGLTGLLLKLSGLVAIE